MGQDWPQTLRSKYCICLKNGSKRSFYNSWLNDESIFLSPRGLQACLTASVPWDSSSDQPNKGFNSPRELHLHYARHHGKPLREIEQKLHAGLWEWLHRLGGQSSLPVNRLAWGTWHQRGTSFENSEIIHTHLRTFRASSCHSWDVIKS